MVKVPRENGQSFFFLNTSFHVMNSFILRAKWNVKFGFLSTSIHFWIYTCCIFNSRVIIKFQQNSYRDFSMFVACDSAGSASCKIQQSWKIACSSEKAKKRNYMDLFSVGQAICPFHSSFPTWKWAVNKHIANIDRHMQWVITASRYHWSKWQKLL